MSAPAHLLPFGLLITALLLAGCAGGADEPAAPASAATAAPSPAPAGPALSLTRGQMVAALAERDLSPEAFDAQTLGDGREVTVASFPETTTRQVLWVGIFGGEAPHTVRLDYFPANARADEAQAVGAAIDRLLVALFPGWEDAPQWPEVAGTRAWQETAKLAEAEPDNTQVPVLETRQGETWLSALGVPARIVSYVITAREVCRPSQADGFYEGYPACR